MLSVILAAWRSFALDPLFRLQPVQRLRKLLWLPEAFSPRTAQILLISRRLLGAAVWLALLIGTLVALAETRADPGVYSVPVVVIGIALGIWAIVWTASIRFPAIGVAFGFPWVRLLILGAVYVLLPQEWFVNYGFSGSPLWPALALGLGLGYLRRALINVAGVSHSWDSARWARWLLSDERIAFPAALLSAAAVAIPVWGALSVLPNINAILLSQRPDLAIGESSMPSLSKLMNDHQVDWRRRCLFGRNGHMARRALPLDRAPEPMGRRPLAWYPDGFRQSAIGVPEGGECAKTQRCAQPQELLDLVRQPVLPFPEFRS